MSDRQKRSASMTTSTPPQGVPYLGHITDSGRWANFRRHADDIFICTPPKCGTTWTQAICAMLVSGRADHGQLPGMVSPWVDSNFAPIEDYLRQVEAQTHRRYLKTHTPFDGLHSPTRSGAPTPRPRPSMR